MLPAVLDHDEEQALAEIEANLRMEAPELSRILEAEVADLEELLALVPAAAEPSAAGSAASSAASASPSHRERARAWGRSVLAFALAVAAIAVTTVAVGPDLGGLVGAVSLTVALAYSYQAVRGCPGRR